jgi:hypothetical protein
MIWTSEIITHRLRRVRSEEDRARVPNLARYRLVVACNNLNVFRRQFIHDRTRFIERLHQNDRAVVFQRCHHDLTPWQ